MISVRPHALNPSASGMQPIVKASVGAGAAGRPVTEITVPDASLVDDVMVAVRPACAPLVMCMGRDTRSEVIGFPETRTWIAVGVGDAPAEVTTLNPPHASKLYSDPVSGSSVSVAD